MSYTITNLKNDMKGILHGTTVNKITGFYTLCDRAASQLLLDVDPQETIRMVQMTNPIYSEVFDYTLPTDLKGNAVIDIRPQVDRTKPDWFMQAYSRDFDRMKETTTQAQFNINFNTGNKTIRLVDPTLPTGVTIASLDGVTAEGTWIASGTASSVETDNLVFASGGGSVRFNLDAGSNPSTGGLVNTTIPSIDLTNHYNQSRIFAYVYLPTPTDVTSVEVRWGSGTANYYSRTMTTQFDGTAFQVGWNLVSGLWLGATVVGTPNKASITYAAVLVTYNGTQQIACRADNIVSRLGTILDIQYYSKYLFRTSGGAFQETVTDDTNIVNLDTEARKLFTDLVALYCVQQALGSDSSYDTGLFQRSYDSNLKTYKMRYKSQIQKPQSIYYQVQPGGMRKYFGRMYNP